MIISYNIDLEKMKNPIISFLISEWSFFVKPWVSFTKGCFLPSLVEIDQVVLEERILNFVNVSLPFHNYMYLPFEKGMTLLLNKFESPSPKDALCQVWLKPSLRLRWAKKWSEKLTWDFSSGQLKSYIFNFSHMHSRKS